MPTWYPVAKVGQLKAGDVLPVEADGVQMVIGRDGDRYFAVQRRCAHQGGDLADGIISRGHIICANHGWRFSTATGRHDSASEFCLVSYAVRVNGEDIEVDPIPRTLRGH
jgi:3-phenylpropionate/trans-cinnamate dioxygenase ferredoxin subunit